MQFCPQCGTSFGIQARFCQECGFDRLSIEPVSPEPSPAPEVLIDDPGNNTTQPDNKTDPETTFICPHCGTFLGSGDRFCLECGFDTLTGTDVAEETKQAIPQPVVEETNIEISPAEENVPVMQNKLFCTQCGSVIEPAERFCQECGFDTKPGKTPIDIIYQTAGSKHSAEPQPLVEPVLPPPPTAQVHTKEHVINQNEKHAEHTLQPKRNKAWLRIALIIIGVLVLGTAAWFGYNKYSAIPEGSSADTNAKPMSLMDQELAKHPVPEQNQETQQTTSGQQTDKSSTIDKKGIPSKVIFEVGQSEKPKNKNPKNPAKLTISKPTMITRITTDHYNSGMGTPRGGNIFIKDRYGITLGTYRAFGKKGINGTPSAKWVAEPNVILAKGTYFISDSENQTWSRTLLGSNGFVVVEGYEVE